MKPCNNVKEFKENYAKLEKGDKSVCFDENLKDPVNKEDLNEQIKKDAAAEKSKNSVFGKIKGAFRNLKEKISNYFNKDADKKSPLKNAEPFAHDDDLYEKPKVKKELSRSSTIDLSNDKGNKQPVKDRRDNTIPGQLGRHSGSIAKEQGEDPKKASHNTKNILNEQVDTLSASKVSGKTVNNSELPNEQEVGNEKGISG